jgi:hypothetical protein
MYRELIQVPVGTGLRNWRSKIYPACIFILQCRSQFSMRYIQAIRLNHTHLQLDLLLHRGTNYCAVRIFNKLPTRTAGLKNDKRVFQSALTHVHMFSIPQKNF